jgi:hypothetical protein
MRKMQMQPDNDLMSLLNQIEENDDVSLPYNGSSGWSGTDTSKERAEYNDTYGKTQQIQAFVFRWLMWRNEKGATWREIAEASGWHHGSVSGALSVLHKEGRISRLLEKRDRCRVYVLNEYVSGRETDSQGRKPKECPNCGYHL